MDAGLLIIAGAAGLITYKVVSDGSGNAAQPAGSPKSTFWPDWMNGGGAPATGNGAPTMDQTGKDIAETIQAVGKFGTSLLYYFGTAQDNESSGGGTSTGGPTNQYSSGGQDWP